MPAIQAFGGAPHELKRFDETVRAYTNHATRNHRVNAGARATVNFLGVVGIAFVLGFGTMALGQSTAVGESGGLTLDRLVGFALYAALLADPLTRLTRATLEIQRALAAARRVFELMD